MTILRQTTSTPVYSTESDSSHTSKVSDEKKLNDLVEIDSKPILVVYSVFPFDLFPTKIILDRSKLTIIYNNFLTRYLQTILIPNVLNIVIEEAVILSNLLITDRLIPQETISVPNLSKRNAQRIRRLVQGLLIAQQKNVDVAKIDTNELLEKLEIIGKSN